MRTLLGMLGAVAMAGAALTGCSFNIGVNSQPVVSKERLQEDISDRLAEAGEEPESVTCRGDLTGEVGKTTRCEVVISATNSFEPVVTVTGVDGETVNYEMTPALSREQVEKAASGLVEEVADVRVDSVSCASGLEGTEGEVTSCDVDAEGVEAQWDVAITDVDGLLMNVKVFPVLQREDVEQALRQQLTRRIGFRPDSVDCTSDLVGDPGTTIDCLVVAGDESETFAVTVTTVDGSTVNYRYEPR